MKHLNLTMKILAIVVTLAFCLNLVAYGQTAREVVELMDKNARGDYVTQEMTMDIIRPTWKRTISLKSWGRGMDYSMIYITAPAKEKGQVFMKRDKEMWNWVPSIDRMIKLPPTT